MKVKCVFCGHILEVPRTDKYVQCDNCGQISQVTRGNTRDL